MTNALSIHNFKWVKTLAVIGLVVLFIILTLLFIGQKTKANADVVSELQTKIDQRNSDIKNLEKEIAEYQKQINSLNSQASSLSSTIKSLELTKKKLETDIEVTENKIATKNLEIQQLSGQIDEKTNTIEEDRRIINQSLVDMNRLENQSLVELLLGSRSLATAWNDIDNLGTLQGELQGHVKSLRQVKAGLEVNKAATERARTELVSLQRQLGDQRKVVIGTVNEKNELLDETKESEASYKKLLSEREALKDAFERELLAYEAELQLTVDTSLLPKSGSGILSWPLDNVFITQYFGNTPFATANSQIYNGKGHTGIDLRASIGTPVRASLSGTVVGVANTDAVRGCYSYGKWIMIKHPGGLSTLYAHLSLQSVSTGQQVSTGEIIGYSGNTGYSTGPHLHYGVYATQGVQIKTFDNSINCKGAIIPLADLKAYLNPLSYLRKQ